MPRSEIRIEIRIAPCLFTDGGFGTTVAVARPNDGFRRQIEQPLADRLRQLLHRAAGEVGAAYAADKKGVASEAVRRMIQTDAARTVARRVDHGQLLLTDADDAPVLD